MVRLQAFKYELKPNGDQQRQMRRFAGSCRFVYNHALALQKERYERGEKKLGYAGLCKELTLRTPWRTPDHAHSAFAAPDDCVYLWGRLLGGYLRTPRGGITRPFPPHPRAAGEKDLAIQMNARPVLGIDNDVLWATAQSFGADACGEDVWDGKKLAILNILNPISGIGHYVVALRSDASGAAVVYCPYYARTIRLTAPWLKDHWRSGDSVYKNWAITFPRVLPDDVVAIGEEWTEMGLAPGEINPYWLLRSANRFLTSVVVE